MGKLIDAEKHKESVERWQRILAKTYGKNDEYVVCIEGVLELLEDAPAVDAVPVVRCQDCKNLRLVEGARGRWFGCSAIDGVDGNEFEVEGDFYCAWGERREGDAVSVED